MMLEMSAATPSNSEPELLALVRSIHRQGQTGLVELRTAGTEKHLYFVNGELYLLASAPSALNIAKLMRMQLWGHQSSRHTLALLYARIAERFASWRADSFSFIEGSRAPRHQLVGPLPTARILMAAASEERVLEHLRQQLGAADVELVAAGVPTRPLPPSLGPAEHAVLGSLDEPMPLVELLARTEYEPAEAFDAVARLWAVGLLRETSEPPAPAIGDTVAGGDGVVVEEETAGAPSAATTAAREDEIHRIWRRYFGLKGDPFSLTPDPAYLFISEGHGEALAGLKLGVLERRGLLAMTGEVGTGKTTLLYALLSGLDPEIEAAYIYNTTLSCEEILQSALIDFGVSYTGSSRLDLLAALNDLLTQLAASDRTAALVIDEAQNLSDDTFEQLRLLLNFETYDRKLLQIVLVGQPELARRLRAPQLRQIADRIAVRCHLDPLSRDEARQYVLHRLEAAGGSAELFTRRALRLVVRKTRGIPRRINVACHNAMLFAYAAGERRVRRTFVREALRETIAPASTLIGSRPRSEPGHGGSRAQGLVKGLTRAFANRKGAAIGLVSVMALTWLSLTPAKNPVQNRHLEAGLASAVDSEMIAVHPQGRPGENANSPVPANVPASRAVNDIESRSVAPEPRLWATTVNLRMRSTPDLTAPVLMVLPQGTGLSVLDTQGDWLRVTAPDFDHSGWVSRLYVAGLDVEAQSSAMSSSGKPGP